MTAEAFFIGIPIADWIDAGIEWLEAAIGPFLSTVGGMVRFIIVEIEGGLNMIPPPVLILLVALAAWYVSGWRLALGSALGLYLTGAMGLWPEAMSTFALIVASAAISVAIGVPIGVWAARSDAVLQLVRPVLDVMQTMPAFVYLIPAITFFSIGPAPATFATVVYATPPAVRLTNLGIRQVDPEIIEAAHAFGSTERETLLKVQLPLAWPSILQGINQTILLAVAMVVIASMIGAGGLGNTVLNAITQIEVGAGFEGGIAIVVVAMILDRMMRAIGGGETDESNITTGTA